jgi:16S rRNA (adenine1518-N6/adenine1519-N6)-dimethyltransferase
VTEPDSPGGAPSGPAFTSPLRDVLAGAGITADKRFGQHFLLDLNVCRKIARLAGPLDGQVVYEVGPGPGGLTRALLETGARVTVVERDPRFIPVLQQLAAEANGALEVIEADALEFDEAGALGRTAGAKPVHIVANLPYNVGTPLLVKWLTGTFIPASMTLMFQKEVAERIIAAVGATEYGRLAVLCQTVCDVRCVLDLPARAFTPPPKVASAVVHLTQRAERPSAAFIAALQEVTRAAFGQRRKMLRSSLKSLGGGELCRSAGIDSSARAETVSIEGFARLAEALRAAHPV